MNQRLLLESKEHMRARGIRSPDEWDAVCLTFAEPVKDIPRRDRRGRAPLFRVEYDPMQAFAEEEQRRNSSPERGESEWLRRRALGLPFE